MFWWRILVVGVGFLWWIGDTGGGGGGLGGGCWVLGFGVAMLDDGG